MKHEIAKENERAEALIPPAKPDGSRIGVNYADAYIKVIKANCDGVGKVTCKRRGLKITFKIGDKTGESVMRRLENGPDVKNILHAALIDAAADAGAVFSVEDGVMYLDIPE